MYNPFEITGKTILVTGASSGIGRAIAIECSKLGANLVITGRNVDRLNDTLALLEGGNHQAVVADLTIEEELESLVTSIQSLNGIVHSAGISNPLPFLFVDKQELDKIFKPNFFSPVILSQLLIKKKKLEKNSSIVFISSISGVYTTSTGGAIYSASKAALNAISKTMALELSGKNIRVNCINPGMIETDILENTAITNEQIQNELSKYPLKRFGKPIEVAHSALYLLSDASKWVTGSNLLIDGGYMLQK